MSISHEDYHEHELESHNIRSTSERVNSLYCLVNLVFIITWQEWH